VVLGMVVQRVVFHYGIELEGLKYNGPELGEFRRRIGPRTKVELTFDPGDLGHINVLDPQRGTYIRVPAVDQAYAQGLSLWQHRVIRRYSRNQLKGRTDLVALAEAKAEIRALVDRDLNRKAALGRKRHARFTEGASTRGVPGDHAFPQGATPPQLEEFNDDQVLPAFEANLDLPHRNHA
jgi:putative transposase